MTTDAGDDKVTGGCLARGPLFSDLFHNMARGKHTAVYYHCLRKAFLRESVPSSLRIY